MYMALAITFDNVEEEYSTRTYAAIWFRRHSDNLLTVFNTIANVGQLIQAMKGDAMDKTKLLPKLFSYVNSSLGGGLIHTDINSDITKKYLSDVKDFNSFIVNRCYLAICNNSIMDIKYLADASVSISLNDGSFKCKFCNDPLQSPGISIDEKKLITLPDFIEDYIPLNKINEMKRFLITCNYAKVGDKFFRMRDFMSCLRTLPDGTIMNLNFFEFLAEELGYRVEKKGKKNEH